MINSLMSLGLFVFSLKTAPFDKINRSTDYRWAENARFNQGAAAQFLGPGTDTITLTGQLAPQITGGSYNLDLLRIMAGTGKAWPLIDGRGFPLGYWYIESQSEDRSYLTDDGQARKIDFTLKLKRYFGKDVSNLGDLAVSIATEVLG
jgi:uncharacterized protein